MKKLCIGIIVSLALVTAMVSANAQGPSFAGTWETTGTTFHATIDFKVWANEAAGTYMNGQGRITGMLDLQGKTLTGSWSETTGDGVVMGSGDIVLYLSGDGNNIDGTIWSGPRSGPGSPFTAVRVE